MEDRDYRLFAGVVDCGSISAAGARLGLSPAAASKRLAALEDRLGVLLIRRTTRSISLTYEGQVFHEDVRTILAAIDAAEARVAGRIERPRGHLRISAPTSFGRLHVARRLQSFLERFPDVEPELVLDDEYTDLSLARIDVAVRIAADPATPLLAAELISPNPRILCASPDYLGKHGVPESLDALPRHRLLAAQHQSPWRLEAGARRRRIDVKSAVVTNSSEVVREIAIAGGGIALRSYWDVSDELASGALQRILAPWEGATDVGIYAVYMRAPPHAAATLAFVRYLAGTLPKDRENERGMMG